jgi:hypothetical protein
MTSVNRRTWTDSHGSTPQQPSPPLASSSSATTQPLPTRPPPVEEVEELPDAEPELRIREFALIYATYMTYLACRRNCACCIPPFALPERDFFPAKLSPQPSAPPLF